MLVDGFWDIGHRDLGTAKHFIKPDGINAKKAPHSVRSLFFQQYNIISLFQSCPVAI